MPNKRSPAAVFTTMIRSLLLLTVISSGACAQISRFYEGGKVGYRAADGTVVVPPAYDAGSEIIGGYAIVVQGGLRGYLDASGRLAIPLRFTDVRAFHAGLAGAAAGGKYGLIDTTGAWTVPPLCEGIYEAKEGFWRFRRDGAWGFLDARGREAIPARYGAAEDFSGGLAAARAADGLWGYVDTKGALVIPARYRTAGAFVPEGEALVMMPDGERMYINRAGKKLREAEERGEEWELRTREGKAPVRR